MSVFDDPEGVSWRIETHPAGALPVVVLEARGARSAFLASGNDPADWAAEMRRRRAADATSFHDRLILLHPAPYAGLAPSEVGDDFDAVTWTASSMRLRLEHEFTHHATARLLGS